MGTEIRSIELNNIHLSYPSIRGRKDVLKGITVSIPENRSLGILGRNGAGKSTLINIISGLLHPDKGEVNRNGLRLSWPIGKPTFQSNLSARNNVKFIARITGMDVKPVMEFVEDFTELGDYIDMPLTSYSAGMKARLGFAVSMAVDYDCLLIDEGFGAGDARFKKRMDEVFQEKFKDRNMICISHNVATIKRYCDYAAILRNGKLELFEDLEEAFDIYKDL